MSNVNKATPDEDLLGVVDMDSEQVKWSSLDETYRSIGNEILETQQVILEAANLNEEKIEADAELMQLIDGLLKTINDIANELAAVKVEYIAVTGETDLIAEDDDDSIMNFVKFQHEMISIGEKLTSVVSFTITDVMIRLKLPDELIKENIALTQDIVATKAPIEVKEGVEDGKQQ